MAHAEFTDAVKETYESYSDMRHMSAEALEGLVEKDYAGIQGHKRVTVPTSQGKIKVATAPQPADTVWVEKAKAMFSRFDQNGDGCLSPDELTFLLSNIAPGLSKHDITLLMQEADKNVNGKIEFSEFVDWLCAPPVDGSITVGRAIIDAEYLKCFTCLFEAYDKDGTGEITAENFEECHCMLQGALRLTAVDDDDEHRADPLDLKSDHDEAFSEVDTLGTGVIHMTEFVQWMLDHVPASMDKGELYEYTSGLASMIKSCQKVMAQAEEGFLSEKDGHILEDVIGKVAEKAREFHSMGEDKSALAAGQSQWTKPPMGLNVEKLKRVHMSVVPLQMKRVRPDGIEWEILCLPNPGKYDDPESRVWLAEVVRRVTYKSGKVCVEDPEYYIYDRKTFSWKTLARGEDSKFVEVFDKLSPGIGIFCLLKTAANFGIKLRWEEIQTSLHGAVDFKLLKPEHLEAFNREMEDRVQKQMESEGLSSDFNTPEEALKYALEWLQNNFCARPREVMAVLSILHIVEVDPAWQDFV